MNAGHANEGMRCIKIVGYEKLFSTKIRQLGSYYLFLMFRLKWNSDVDAYDIFVSSGGPGLP